MMIVPLGDAGLLVRLGETIDLALAARVRRQAARVRAAEIDGVRDVTPAYASFAVFFDARRTTYAAVARAVAAVPEGEADGSIVVREHRIPVRYNGVDLGDVARRTGLSVDEVIARHAAVTYTVYCLGFVPGFGYLGDLDPRLVLGRRDEPRRRVPAGAVAIAGTQTAVYPLETPGGWHLIGHTAVPMFDPHADPPARLAAGDRVRFVPEDGP
jgi:KipI family sensor histidine kinase inhibitor